MSQMRDLPRVGWTKRASDISQKIISSDECEYDIIGDKYDNYIPKKELDKVAQKVLSKKT